MDHMAQEQEQGITITSATTTCVWDDHRINIIDTPGHVDFTIEVERSPRVLDGAVTVFDSVAGVEPQTKPFKPTNTTLPRFCYVNKMDRIGANFYRTVEMVESRLQANPLVIQLPVGAGGPESNEPFAGLVDLAVSALIWQDEELGAKWDEVDVQDHMVDGANDYQRRMMETIATSDEEVMEKYLGGEGVSIAEIKARSCRNPCRRFRSNSVRIGLQEQGCPAHARAVIDYLPSPIDIEPAQGTNLRGDEEILRGPDDDDLLRLRSRSLRTHSANSLTSGVLGRNRQG